MFVGFLARDAVQKRICFAHQSSTGAGRDSFDVTRIGTSFPELGASGGPPQTRAMALHSDGVSRLSVHQLKPAAHAGITAARRRSHFQDVDAQAFAPAHNVVHPYTILAQVGVTSIPRVTSRQSGDKLGGETVISQGDDDVGFAAADRIERARPLNRWNPGGDRRIIISPKATVFSWDFAPWSCRLWFSWEHRSTSGHAG